MRARALLALSLCLALWLALATFLPAQAQDIPDAGGQFVFMPAVRNQPAPVCVCTADAATLPAAGSVIPNQFIVTLEAGDVRAAAGDTVSSADFALATVQQYGGDILFTYDSALEGFAATLSPEAVAALESNPSVAAVEPNRVIRVAPEGEPAPAVYAPLSAEEAAAILPWGLDRIDQRDLSLNGSFSFTATGAGAHVYVIDTGVRRSHQEFGYRIGLGFTSVVDGNGVEDCYGHGTHVAGTVAGSTIGVARAATIHPVRVLDACGSGDDAMVIAGIDWVTKNAVKPAVANMSLGGDNSFALASAVRTSILAGITYVVAAGNDNYDACFYSPADVPAAITVGAIDKGDWRSSYSNYGTCVDIFAPGTGIFSSSFVADNAYEYLSGTSMATPHVAGVAATYVAGKPSATPAEVNAALVSASTAGRLSAIDVGSPNRLLFNQFTTTSPPFACTDVVLNGGFESGATVWKSQSSNGFDLMCSEYSCGGWAYPRTGAYVAWLGGANDERASITQRLTVPKNAGAMLSYWYYIQSREGACDIDYAWVQVKSDGKVVRDVPYSLCLATYDSDWHNDSIDLSDLAGKTIDIIFSATTSESLVSGIRFDDVRVRSGTTCAVAWSGDEAEPNADTKTAPADEKGQ